MTNATQHSKFNIQNLFWPLLILVLGAVALLQALEVFPPAVADLLGRSWPLLLVIVGLAFGLGQVKALQRWAWLIALAASLLLMVGIVAAAYGTRAAQERTENVVDFEQALGAGVTRLAVDVAGLETHVEILSAEGATPVIRAAFSGSMASVVEPEYREEGAQAFFTLREARPDALPLLEQVGRGRLRLELPPGLALDLAFANSDGEVSLNLGELDLATLRVDVGKVDDLLLTLPARSLSAPAAVLVQQGNLTVLVPPDLGLLIRSSREPQVGAGLSMVRPLGADFWRSEGYEDFAAQAELNLTVLGGTLRLQPLP